MKKTITTLVCAFAVLAFATTARAENDDWAETTDLAEEVDWEEAIEFAELIETFEQDGAVWEVYLDEAQNLLWAQISPEYLSDGEKVEDTRTTYVNPFYLYFCHDNNCNNDTPFSSFTFDSNASTSTHKVWWAFGTAPVYGVYRVKVWGNSGSTDYCDSYDEFYWNGPGSSSPSWKSADDDWCGSTLFGYSYLVDEWTEPSNWTYGYGEYVVRWRYQIGRTTHRTTLRYAYIE